MKRIIALFMALVMCFLLTGCGKEDAKYEKYNDLIDMLEEEDYEGAIEEIEKMSGADEDEDDKDKDDKDKDADVTGTTESEVKSVEITLDNWDEYFEMCMMEQFSENGFGECDACTVWWHLLSKEGLKPDWEKSDVTYEYILTTDEREITVDFENRKITYGKVISSDVSEPEVNDFVQGSSGLGFLPRYGDFLSAETFFSQETSGETVDYVTGIEIIRIKGTFYYTEEK